MRYLIIIQYLLLLYSFLSSDVSARTKEKAFTSAWQFRKVGDKKWMSAQVPGTVHTDLMKNKLIPDPFYRDNESKVHWVSEVDWEYRCRFIFKDTFYHFLVFEGLDTYADVYVNGKFVLQANNMFRTWKISTKKCKLNATNELRIIFLSPLKIADSLAKQHQPLHRPCENNRHYIRKAQYHYGWDWAPNLPTCGIWKPIKWATDDSIQQTKSSPVNVMLHKEKDIIGEAFYFTVDGKPTFMKGANWIPADVFLPRIGKQKYRNLLIAAKEANINMLRVWGGGIYEDDYFYSLCDSLDIFIWQDFMFAGAMYPADSLFVKNIKQEAIEQICRLRKYKCIALWCGNNEIEEAWRHWGWQKQFSIHKKDSVFMWDEYKKIFYELLPSLVEQYDSGRSYISTSPMFGWGSEKSMTHGDSHYWGLWWGLQPLKIMQQKIPRFMSEYGMQAMPSMESIQQFSLAADWDTASVVMQTHQKHPTGYKNLQTYLTMENIQANTFQEFVAATQELQARTIQTTVEAQMQSDGRCMGSLLWQWNDCWPVTSWSVIDFYGRKKKGYEALKKVYAERKVK
jgi:beta-mannosidase